MQLINFDNIDEMTGGGDRLPAGGYVARITKVEDVPSKQYLWVEYDIAEGPYAGHFANVGDRPYLHRFSRSYKDAAQGFFKAFLLRLTESNRGRFDWQQWQQACNEQLSVGLAVGIVTVCCIAGGIRLVAYWYTPLFIIAFAAMMIVPGHILNHKARKEA